MNWQVGQRFHGFVVDRVRRVDELDAELVEMTHEQAGTKLCYFDSLEENKLFSITFKTLPENDTGVFHILEHSVLCGSDKYPVREPFVELIKGSMNTFLNAMTFSDKTMYPVSSLNETDFLNLTEVYLDAVFAPAILHNPCIFEQEGWHIEWPDRKEKPVYKGVVFNEMKGAMSSVDEVMEQEVLRTLFPESCYGFNSGGDPEHIPELSYEQFIATYKRFYHPENAYIWLDGKIPLEKTFALIDSYLSRFTRQGNAFPIAPQRVRPADSAVRPYEIAQGEDREEKTHLMLCKLFSGFEDKTALYGVGLLSDVLCSGNDTPVKRALLDEGLCQDVSMGLSDGIAQECFELWMRNTEEDRIPRIREVVRETVGRIVREGIDREELQAAINRLAFRLKEPTEPQGLIRAIQALNSWLYEGDPLLYLTSDDVIQDLREKLNTTWYEDLLRQLLLEEGDLHQLTLVPDPALGDKTRQAEEARLSAVMDAMTEEEKDELIKENGRLARWQQTPDTQEQLDTLPKLPISAVSEEPEFIDTMAEERGPVTVLYHRVPCGDIVHVRMYFALTDLSLSDLTRMTLITETFAEQPTKKHTVTELQRMIRLYTGSLDFGLEVMAKLGQKDRAIPCLTVSCSCLKEYETQAADLIREILLETDFTQEALIREILLQTDDDLRQSVVMAGNRFGVLRTQAHYSAAGAASEAVNGLTAVRYIHRLVKGEEDLSALSAFWADTVQRVVCQSRLTMSMSSGGTCDPAPFLAGLPLGEAAPADGSYRYEGPKKEGVLIPAQITFASVGGDLSQVGLGYDGTASVLSNILSFAYLWNAVRVQGGAYGVSAQIGPTGRVTMASYRDPDAAHSLQAYRDTQAFVQDFVRGDEDLTRYIISTIGQMSPLTTPRQKGVVEDIRWFSGITLEKRRQERQTIIGMKKEDLLKWLPALRQASEEGTVCVVGYQAALDKCKGLEVSEL